MKPHEIRSALADVGISQADVSRASGISRQILSRVISGGTVSHPAQVAIAAALGLPVEQVFPARYPDQAARQARLDAISRATEQVKMAS